MKLIHTNLRIITTVSLSFSVLYFTNRFLYFVFQIATYVVEVWCGKISNNYNLLHHLLHFDFHRTTIHRDWTVVHRIVPHHFLDFCSPLSSSFSDSISIFSSSASFSKNLLTCWFATLQCCSVFFFWDWLAGNLKTTHAQVQVTKCNTMMYAQYNYIFTSVAFQVFKWICRITTIMNENQGRLWAYHQFWEQ